MSDRSDRDVPGPVTLYSTNPGPRKAKARLAEWRARRTGLAMHAARRFEHRRKPRLIH